MEDAMNNDNQKPVMEACSLRGILGADAFSRLDERPDADFYSTDRFVNHLDDAALSNVKTLIERVVTKNNPVVLDLMASWDSHLPGALKPARVVGLGLNKNELVNNEALTEWVVHDLNENPRLPFPDNTFDVVLNTVSVDYLIRPIEIFQEVSRILKPEGLFLVIFSNRLFPEKAVKIWNRSSDEARTRLVENYFNWAGGFSKPRVYSLLGGERPPEDRYAGYGLPADPIFAVYGFAERTQAPLPITEKEAKALLGLEVRKTADLTEKMKKVKESLQCPYCGKKMQKWAVPQGPFTEWENDFMYICFNDTCPYLVRGWEVMGRQGNTGISYRCMYYPEKDVCMPVPIFSLQALRESIVQD
jgi:SAM-dependent methyltransferase